VAAQTPPRTLICAQNLAPGEPDPYPVRPNFPESRVYSILLSVSVSLLLSFSGVALGWYHWIWGIVFTAILFLVTMFLINRKIGAIVHPAMAQVQQHLQQGRHQLAMQAMEDLLPMGKWVPMLTGALHANMGMIAYQTGDKEKGVRLLEGSSLKNAEARLMLASIRYRSGETERAIQILELSGKLNKKHALLHNTHAWMLHKAGKNDEAQAVLAAFLKKDPNNGPSKDNMLRLQNRTRMNMQAFEMNWYALQLEQPPQSMGQARRAPKGFREPPKRRKGG